MIVVSVMVYMRNYKNIEYDETRGARGLVLKSVPKVVAHFAFFVNIFRNFNAICDFFLL